jgi:hypothetical protein
VLVLDKIDILPPLGKYKYDTWRILSLKCYIDNSVRLRSCIRNVNTHPVFFYQIFILVEGGVLVPPNLHKLTLVAPPSMRDDLHSYLLPLLLQLFQILSVWLNRVFEEFILFFIFGQLIESLQG